MVITVRFIGALRGLSGSSKLALEFDDVVSLEEAINEVVKELPTLKSTLIEQELGNVRSSMLILVNGKEIGVLNGLETSLKDGDEIVLVPVLHGG